MKGIIYALTNPAILNKNGRPYVKIGKTSDIDRRLKELYHTSVPFPFKCEYAVEVDDMDEAERRLHKEIFYEERVNPRREFFDVDIDKVVAVLRFAGENITEQVKEVLEDEDSSFDLRGNNIFRFKVREVFATGVYNYETDEMTVLKGSVIRDRVANFDSPRYRERRENILETKVARGEDGLLRLTEDITFRSPSMASEMCYGGSTSGRLDWKSEEGETLKSLQERYSKEV